MNMAIHNPVLLSEVVENLAIKADGVYMDGTFGRGGHSGAILQKLGSQGRLLAVDKDICALQAAKDNPLFYQDKRFCITHASFTQLHILAAANNCLGKVNGIVLDLGVSSPQLDEAGRGFSFLKEGPLDMRMNKAQFQNARDWINQTDIATLIYVLKTYGEERFAHRIATQIISERQQATIETTTQLAKIVAKAHPRWEPHKHPATRTFQAIRIFINQELTELEQVLSQSLEILTVGGRLLIICFHSLEDKVVKTFVQRYGTTQHVPRELPLTDAILQKMLRLKWNKKVIRPTSAEKTQNPRARSAFLRIIEKIK